MERSGEVFEEDWRRKEWTEINIQDMKEGMKGGRNTLTVRKETVRCKVEPKLTVHLSNNARLM
jgi:hypothetical protein